MIVEDELLVALDIERTLEDLGFEVVGVAADQPQAHALAAEGVDAALIDLNLRDGLTGLKIGDTLARSGVSVVFMTANPDLVAASAPGVMGVIAKPVSAEDIRQTTDFVRGRRAGRPAPAPARLRRPGEDARHDCAGPG
jgi:two-component system, response regulator PdtaR